MGCTNSKPKVCQKCRAHYSPVHQSYSMNIHNPIDKEGSSFHLVSLISSTLGSLRLDPLKQHIYDDQLLFEKDDTYEGRINKEEFETGLIEAKTWSQMINEKIPKVIPKTPITTPPDGEPENVNVWELMEDLEDTNLLKSPHHVRSFSFHVLTNPYDQLKSNCEVTEHKLVQQNEGKVILYFTSLRGVRKTYEDCCHVRMILKGLGVKIDERDVSMHAGFKEELKELLLGEEYSGGVLLPRVFLGRKYIGGADEICRMHDNGQLEKVVESCERVENGVCEGCGDSRFVPCETCYGSRKIYYEAEYDEEDECGFQRCPDCNENGLTRCPSCCD